MKISIFSGKTVATIMLLFSAGASFAQPQISSVPGELIVKFKTNVQQSLIQTTFRNNGIERLEHYTAINVFRCRVEDQQNVQGAIRACAADPNIEYAEPNYIYTKFPFSMPMRISPDDPRFRDLWAMKNGNDADIDAVEAWDRQKGSKDVLVAVIDTGVDYNHEDLSANAWRNPGESGDGKETNGIDDDNNGYIDDVYGWDFVNNDADPMDDNMHGTHVAGTIGAEGDNGKGVVGVNWQVSIMGLKFLDGNGSGELADAVQAIVYAADNGAKILNNSWGGGGFSKALEDAIKYARDKGALFVAAAGNSGTNNDTKPSYPANYEVENVISVAASDHQDAMASFSQYGSKTVDISAPGVDIMSTVPGNRYAPLDGTSMATPHVSGAAALILAQYPDLNYREVMVRILGGADRKNALDRTVTGGRLNVNRSISADPLVAVLQTPVDTDETEGPYIVIAEVIDDSVVESVVLTYTVNGGSETMITMQKTPTNAFKAEIPGQSMDSKVAYTVTARDNDNNETKSRRFEFKVGTKGCAGLFLNLDVKGNTWMKALLVVLNMLLLTALISKVGKPVRVRR